MIETLPKGCGDRIVQSWNATKRVTLELIEDIWEQIDDTPFPDIETAPYAEWMGGKGQKKADGLKHGVVMELDEGILHIRSYKNGRKHGLECQYYNTGYFQFIARIQ